MQKTKVTIIINDLVLGGAQTVVYDMGSVIDRSHFDFRVLALFGQEKITKPKPDMTEKFRQANIPFSFIAQDRPSSWIILRELTRRLRQEKPDIIHCHLPYSAILGTFAAVAAGVKRIVIHEHNTYQFFSWKVRALLHAIRPFVDVDISYSDSVEEELFGKAHILKHPPERLERKTYTVFNGIPFEKLQETKRTTHRDEKRASIGLTTDDFIINSTARLIDWKGQSHLIRAFRSISERYPNAKLLIVGGGEEEQNLKNLAGEDQGKNIFFLGHRTDSYELLAVSDLFSSALTYKDDFSQNTEAIGVASLEAMAFGLPTILADYPTAYKFIQPDENAVLVKPKDIDSLAQALARLIDQPDFRKKLGQNAERFIEQNLTWKHLITIYERIYTLLVQK